MGDASRRMGAAPLVRASRAGRANAGIARRRRRCASAGSSARPNVRHTPRMKTGMSMATQAHDEVIRALDHLLMLSADGAEGYRHAAAAVEDPRIHRLLAKHAAEREEIACVLTNTLVSLGHKPTHH